MLCAAVSVDRHRRFEETYFHDLDGRTMRYMKPTAVLQTCTPFVHVLRTKHSMFYLMTQSVPRSKHTPSLLYKPVS
jgi:hypothetical protein